MQGLADPLQIIPTHGPFPTLTKKNSKIVQTGRRGESKQWSQMETKNIVDTKTRLKIYEKREIRVNPPPKKQYSMNIHNNSKNVVQVKGSWISDRTFPSDLS